MELNDIHTEGEHASTTLKVLLLIFAIVLVGGLGYLVWYQNRATVDTDTNYVITPSATATATGSGAVAGSGTTAATALACGDTTKYGFNMTFGNLWTGMKVKQILQANMDPQPGYAVVTCYFNVPTTSTDTVWTTASTTNYAHYAGLFAVSVYTPAQWATAIAEPAEVPTKLGENANYVWGWSQAQAVPDDLTAAYADAKNVVATFKLVP